MTLKHSLKKLFTFSKKERIAFMILLPAIMIVAALPFVIPDHKSPEVTGTDTAWMAAANDLLQKLPDNNDFSAAKEGNNTASYQPGQIENNHRSRPDGVLFTFDPNTLGAEGFAKLGLRNRTIKTLLNYRTKGGKFRKPEDLAKIYGLRPDEFERLKPYISIPESNQHKHYAGINASASPAPLPVTPEKPGYIPKMIEINSADIAAFESLYGIGNKLAARIVNFRDKLGGFYAIHQVGETFGVPDSTFQRIKSRLQVNKDLIRKMNINKASYNELNMHPYINNKTAFNIVKHRKEKGNFSNIDEIKTMAAATGDSYEKVSPYIMIE
ncbi:MAG TPA: helix-hairpin-helix domain-containing protein [Niabella sp.]|nr:helix-hairpin-helix domain-containing protein [Niabella sp.]